LAPSTWWQPPPPKNRSLGAAREQQRLRAHPLPVHRTLLRATFDGVPEDELRAMLGENAPRFYGLDRDALWRYAERVGPSLESVGA
jgi:hypothetical protein